MFGPGRPDEPFPTQAAEDLRALLRVLYVATPSTNVERRRKLAHLGSELTICIELASRPAGVGTLAAINRADAVCRELAEVIGDTTGAELVSAAVNRVKGKKAV